ncbi:MAG TPA: hypothetical protein VKP30_14650 [Polyangiaceae bacterium]|nr:hypothetical protein [Polyangiaceae bacterium]
MVRSWSLIVWVLVTTGCGSGEGSSEPTGGGGTARGGATPAASGGVLVSGGGTARGGYGGLAGGNMKGGGPSSSGGSGVSASGGQDRGGSGAGELPACVARDDPAAPYVHITWTSEEAQPPLGGVLESGTYFLTSFAYHGGSYEEGYCILALRHEVLRIDAASATEGTLHTTEGSVFEDGSGRLQYKQEVAYATQGTSLTGRYTCWEPHTYVESYTATPNQIRFNRGPFNPTDCHKGVTLVLTYDKQP